MRGNILFKKIAAVLLAGALAAGLAACSGGNDGGSGGGNNSGGSGARNAGGQAEDGYVYVPKFYGLPGDAEADSVWYGSVSFIENRMYYTYTASWYETGESRMEWRYLDVDNPEAEPVVALDLAEYNVWGEDAYSNVSYAAACGDGGTVLLISTEPLVSWDAAPEEQARQARETVYSLKKLAADGSAVFEADITEYLRTDLSGVGAQQLFTDGEGNIYISNQTSCVWVFDKEGKHKADVDLSKVQGYIAAVNVLPDGRLGVLYQGNGGAMLLGVCDSKTWQLSETYDNLPPNCFNSRLEEGPGGGVLINGSGVLYEYSMEEKEYRELIKWISCDINSDNIQQARALADGRIAVYSMDWSQGENSLIVLEKALAAEVEEKKVLTLGCIAPASMLQAAVVEFNKNNDEYRIEIRNYGEGIDYSVENAYADAQTQFYNEILAGNGPDMFLAGDINLRVFVEKDLITDLSPYLESSAAVRREDLFESVLNAYTMEGTLCAIPMCFSIQTLAGRTSEVGTESGWTLEEMIAFADAHPEALIMPHATKRSVLTACIQFDLGSWVNRETGECFFDTPEFKAVLEFANRYPAEVDASLPDERQQLMEHTALLDSVMVSTPQSWQLVASMFGEPITAIGYPASDAYGACVFGYDDVCINKVSENKEAAWAFIETLLAEDMQEDDRNWSFPIRISAFEKRMEKAMEAYYMYDENGEILLDKDGNPVERSVYSYGSEDYAIDIYALKEEEADEIREIISRIERLYEHDGGMLSIIHEEAGPYFEGQKSADEVAGIIQSRISLYLNESR